MATYKELSNFFTKNKTLLTHDETTTVDNFFEDYPDADHFNSFIEDVNYTDDTKSYTSVDREYIKLPRILYLDELTNLVPFSGLDVEDHEPIKAKVTDANQKREFIPLKTRVYPKKPTVRKRRKHWGGKPTYRTYELNAGKSMGYALRSMKRHLTKIDRISIAKVKERMKRSISHTMFKAEVTTYETQKSRMELELFDAYEQFATQLFELEQENTSAKKDAWDFAMPSGALDDFIKDHYAPTIRAFAELPSEMKAFIAKEWNEYGERARKERQNAYGYNLTQQDVDNLQDADLSYMRSLM